MFQSDPVHLVCPWPESAVAANGTHECGVHRQLSAVEQRESVNDDFSLLSRTPPTPRSSSHKNTLVRTLPPASRQMRAAAVSRGNPLRPRIPATEQAERWWPKLSRRRPHTHERAVKESGRRNLRSSRMRKGCGSIRHERSVGNTVKGIDARGPTCDLIKVASLFESVGSKPSQNRVSTTRDTAACHPFLGWLGSSSSTTSGAWTSPEANWTQSGATKPACSKCRMQELMALMLREPLLPSTARKIVATPPDVAHQSS